MNDGSNSPDIALFRQSRILGSTPLRRTGSISLCLQSRKAEVSKHNLGDRIAAREFAAEKYVLRLQVAMDDSGPASRWVIRMPRGVIIAIVKKCNRRRQLDEALPQEVFGNTPLARFR